MEDWKIARINALAQKAKSGAELTAEEQAERAALRREYVDAVKGNLEAHLDRIHIVDKQGNTRKLRKRGEGHGEQ